MDVPSLLADQQRDRPNRLSFYAFNLAGGEGAGADAQFGVNTQVELRPGQWQHLVGTLSPFHGWPEPENPDCAREGASLYQNGKLIDGVAAGDRNDSYWGFPDHAASRLAQPVAFPLVDGTLVLESAAGFRTRGTRVAVVEDDDGHFRPITYTAVTGASLTGCTADGVGTASAGAQVRQGTWEITPGARRGAAPLRHPRPRPIPPRLALPHRDLPEGARPPGRSSTTTRPGTRPSRPQNTT